MQKKILEIKNFLKQNIRIKVIIFTIIFGLFLSTIGMSYAIFIVVQERNNAINIVVGELNYLLTSDQLENGEITVDANTTTMFECFIESRNAIDTDYILYYQGDLPTGVEIKYVVESGETSGHISITGSKKKVAIAILNNSNKPYTASFGVKGGFPKKEIALANNQKKITEEYVPVYSYDYTGDYQTFIAPRPGFYNFEAWGAQGGNAVSGIGGKGGYAKGEIYLEKGEIIYVYVGNQPEGKTGGYNGGADASRQFGAGGGATDFRLKKGNSNDSVSLASRILVAGAGGGAAGDNLAAIVGNIDGSAGGNHNPVLDLVGKNGNQVFGGPIGENGSHRDQATAGSFGVGGVGSYFWGGSGGGGYYGGGGGIHNTPNQSGGGGGGSSYISGHRGCLAVVSETNPTPVSPGVDSSQSYHYSHKVFMNPIILNGNQEMPTHDGNNTQVGNAGNGFAKITYIGQKNTAIYDYQFVDSMQWFLVPAPGKYKIELWGAQGNGNYNAGRGAYVSGVIHLERGENLYLHVGGHPTGIQGGYNGGGIGSEQSQMGAGGGATDVRLLPGVWNDPISLNSRIMVAGGGGGSAEIEGASAFGRAGGLISNNTIDLVGFSGTQTQGGAIGPNYTHNTGTPGSFGLGGNASFWSCGAGGGGYYGGGGGTHYTPNNSGGGGGGSSYVSGGIGCIAITSENDRTPKVQTYTKLSDSYHYSGKIFENVVMKSGQESVNDPMKPNVVTTGRIGHGIAIITLLKE